MKITNISTHFFLFLLLFLFHSGQAQENPEPPVPDFSLSLPTRPDHLIVEAAQPANVDTVIIDGRILKRNGKLIAVDTDVLIKEAAGRFEILKQRAGW